MTYGRWDCRYVACSSGRFSSALGHEALEPPALHRSGRCKRVKENRGPRHTKVVGLGTLQLETILNSLLERREEHQEGNSPERKKFIGPISGAFTTPTYRIRPKAPGRLLDKGSVTFSTTIEFPGRYQQARSKSGPSIMTLQVALAIQATLVNLPSPI